MAELERQGGDATRTSVLHKVHLRYEGTDSPLIVAFADSATMVEELFGPVLSVVRCARFPDAIALVNAHPYANGTAIFTNDGGAARRFSREIEVGMVGINVPIPVPLGFYSFGGWKSPLFGAHSIYGEEGVRFYTRPKVITTRWRDPAHRGVDLGFPRSR